MLIFPTAYFLHINYNESLFIALTVGCFLAARYERWALAGSWHTLCLTRSTVDYHSRFVDRSIFTVSNITPVAMAMVVGLVAPLGFGIYLLLNQYVA
jgi:hypothetical protein